jgi:hypothetical protein
MNIKRDTKGLYTVICNGREWSINDTRRQHDSGAWRWQVYEYGKNSNGDFCGTYKEAKKIIQSCSI